VFAPVADLAELNQRFWRWLECEYNQRAHRALDGASPQQRFQERSEGCVSFPPTWTSTAVSVAHAPARAPRCHDFDRGHAVGSAAACRGRIVDVHYDPFRWSRVELYVEGNKVGDARRCDKQLNARSFGLENYENF